MDISMLILQLLTITISAISLAINFFSTRHENDRKHFLNIATKEQLNNGHKIRENIAVLLYNLSPLLLPILDNEDKKRVMKESVHALEYIKSVLKEIYEEERELIELSNNLIIFSFSYMENGNGALLEQIRNLHKILYRKSAIYDQANWEFIINQTPNKYKSNSNDDYNNKFVLCYKKAVEEFESTSENVTTSLDK